MIGCRWKNILRRQALTGPGRRNFAPSERRPKQGQWPWLPPGPSGRRVRRRASRLRVKRRRLRRRRTQVRKAQNPRQRNRARRRSCMLWSRSDVVRRTSVRAVAVRGASLSNFERGRPVSTGTPPAIDFPISGRRKRTGRAERALRRRRAPSGLLRPSLRRRSRRPRRKRPSGLRSKPRSGRRRGCYAEVPKQRSCIDAPRHRAGGPSRKLSFGARARADTRKRKQLAPKVPRAAETNCKEDDVETGEALRFELRKPRRLVDAWAPDRPVTRGVVCPVNPRRSIEAPEVQTAP